jgi:hypothetical protein
MQRIKKTVEVWVDSKGIEFATKEMCAIAELKHLWDDTTQTSIYNANTEDAFIWMAKHKTDGVSILMQLGEA